MPMPARSRRFLDSRWLLILLPAVVLPVAIVKRLDEDNRFCVSCHLHGQIMREMTAAPAVTLAGAHHVGKGPGHPDRCFTCHSGEGAWGWTQVTLLSAWDAARWVAGDRHEPTAMRLPLTNAACLKCHESEVRGSRTAEETDKFHELTDHRGLSLACAACHRVHRRGEADRTWLQKDVVRVQCARCHRDMGAGGGWN